MGSVATSMPLAIDHPIDGGIARFCDACQACRKYCPVDAIPNQRSPEAGKNHLGNDRYMVDAGRCFPYFAKHSYCSICLPLETRLHWYPRLDRQSTDVLRLT